MSTNAGNSRPKGWYLAREAGWLAGVGGDQIGQWARRRYIRSSRSVGPPRVYSFQDVAEAMVVHLLLERGVPSREIRSGIENLRAKYGDWPLTAAPLATTKLHDGHPGRGEYLILLQGDEQINIGRGEGTEAFLPDLWELEKLVSLLRRGGWVILDHEDIEHIEVDPDRMGGTPTIRNRRLPAEKVAVLAITPGGRQTLQEDYDLDDLEIDDAVRWYRAVSELSAA
jgi:uncharacterized protein (DUF433 family)